VQTGWPPEGAIAICRAYLSEAARVPVTFAAVLIALGLTGALSAGRGGSSIRRAVLRLVIGGALGLAFTYGVGHLFGTAVG
jgi:vacuolar iron transporter family protein